MSGRVLVIGGAGQVGRPAVVSLLGDGWDVTVASRSPGAVPAGARPWAVDRADDEAMDRLLATGFDVVVDVVAFTPQHARQLTRRRTDIGSVVAVSTAGMYVDPAGRALEAITDEASCPRFPGPIDESATTVPAGTSTYARAKRATELELLGATDLPATVIRAATIHGPGSPQPREWFYVRRFRDGRRRVVLGYDGRGAYHPVSTANLAEMIRLAAAAPGTRVLNAGDPGLPDEQATVRGVAAAMDVQVEVVTTASAPPVASPWSLPAPVLLDVGAATTALGYAPVVTYEEGIAATTASLLAEAARGTLQERLAAPRFGAPGLGVRLFMGGSQSPFDYAAEDAVLVGRHTGVLR